MQTEFEWHQNHRNSTAQSTNIMPAPLFNVHLTIDKRKKIIMQKMPCSSKWDYAWR